eukprot:CAMPEP_0117450384 /NCGR_PEP_ID=MMETSP0759-20121206/8440_1 /TAXON_ID=63605 /ORGANISM="Percolomonas cosmopolitus, Strain WS" /LENGTH=1618 /DNA_ID=CAMNT_0005242903 /DNA_START=133 /DNA_END=4986 /DNA_ORIENTATION=+
MKLDLQFFPRIASAVPITQGLDFHEKTTIPVEGGVYDLRMGPVIGYTCKQCRAPRGQCPGHWGAITLCDPLVWPHQLESLVHLLNSCCIWDRRMKFTPRERVLATLCLTLTEFHCIAESEDLWNNPVHFACTNNVHLSHDELKKAKPTSLFHAWYKQQKTKKIGGKSKKNNKSKKNDDKVPDSDEDEKEIITESSRNDHIITPEQEAFLRTKVAAVIASKAKTLDLTLEEYRDRCIDNPTSTFQFTRKSLIRQILALVRTKSVCPHDDLRTVLPKFDIDKEFGSKIVFRVKDNKPNSHSVPGKYLTDEIPFLSKIVSVRSVSNVSHENVVLTSDLAEFLTDVYNNDKEVLDLIYRISTVDEFIRTYLAKDIMVPPNQTRPPEKGTVVPYRCDTYSSLLKRIINQNSSAAKMKRIMIEKELDSRKDATEERKAFKEVILLMQNTLNELINGAGNADWKGLKQEIGKKDGVFRKHFMGKRVNYSARSVITPSLTCNAGEIQIPQTVAKKLSYPVRVTELNSLEMKELVKRGVEYPGCESIELFEGRIVRMSSTDQAERDLYAKQILTKVAVVNRHIINGDYCLFNRQPTLHRPSLMAHEVRVSPIPDEKVIRFHYANCKSYNADFDGDEMNIHFPRNELSRAEMKFLAHAPLQYIDPTRGEPIRGLIQDHVASGVLLSMKDTFLNREDYFQLVHEALYRFMPEDASIQPLQPCVILPQHLWSGKQVFSTILMNLEWAFKKEHHVNYDGRSKLKGSVWQPFEEEGDVIIRGSELLTGILDKNQIGASKKSIVHATFELYGPYFADAFISALSRVLTLFLKMHGFTCSIEDCLLNGNGDAIRRQILSQNIRQTIASTTNFVATQGQTGTKEDQQRYLQNLYTDKGQIKDYDNVFKKVVNKNTEALSNKTVPGEQYRVFPYNFLSLMAESGAKGSRVNVSQIACCLGLQTFGGSRAVPSISGQTMPCFDAFDMRPIAGGFISGRFLTGLKPQEFFFHCMAGREGLNDTALKTADSGYLQRCLMKAMEDVTIAYDHTVRDGHGTVVQFVYGGDGSDPSKLSYDDLKFLALNPESFLDKFTRTLGLTTHEKMPAKKILEQAKSYLSPYLRDDVNRNELEGGVMAQLDQKIKTFIAENPDELIIGEKAKCKPKTLKVLKHLQHVSSVFVPGEAVGVMAAQAVGEPSTQMTLNTFHQTGSDVVGVTQGIPRLRQLLMGGGVRETVMSIPVLPNVDAEKIFKLEVLLSPLNFQRILKKQEMYEVFKESMAEVHLKLEFDVNILEKEYFFPLSSLKQRLYTLMEEICIGSRFLEATKKKSLNNQLKQLEMHDMKSIVRKGLTVHGLCSVHNDWDEEGKKIKSSTLTTMDEDWLMEKYQDEKLVKKLLAKRKEAFLQNREGSSVKKAARKEWEKTRRSFMDNVLLMAPEISIEKGTLNFILKAPLADKQALSQVVSDALKDIYLRYVPNIKMAQYVEQQKMLLVQGLDTDLVTTYRLDKILFEDNFRMNNVHEMIEKYGIEAGRQLIFDELDTVFSSYGQDVNKRHISLISDWTTYLGTYQSMSKYGFKYHPSTFSRATFEIATSVLTEAATYRYVDPLVTPSAQLITGQMTGTGTGVFDVMSELRIKNS